jgi:hypothetical protein
MTNTDVVIPERPQADAERELALTRSVLADRRAFIDEFVIELTRCQRAYVSVHKDDKTDWTAAELGSLAHDVVGQLVEASA